MKMQSRTVKVLLGTLSLTIIIIIGSVIYYSGKNKAQDPRVLEAKNLQRQYEKGIESDQYGLALSLLETMESIYLKTPGYEQSFEIGVILNNKATVHLVKLETELLTKDTIDRESMIATLDTATAYTRRAITIYERWLEKMGALTRVEIEKLVVPTFSNNDPAFMDVDLDAVIAKRVDDIHAAQLETPRRLSVTYTNLGVINRYQGKLEQAKKNYEDAIALWDRNYTAQDNLNILMNQPVQKRSMIDRLFPPERTKEEKEDGQVNPSDQQ